MKPRNFQLTLILFLFSAFFVLNCTEPVKPGVVEYDLYMGQSIKGRSPVSAKEWQEFLDTSVTPRFPQGISVVDVAGQYLYEGAKKPTKENSKLLILVYEETPEVEKKVRAIVHDYAERFSQESVMVIKKRVEQEFWK